MRVHFYKDSEPQTWPKIKDNLRTTRGSFSANSLINCLDNIYKKGKVLLCRHSFYWLISIRHIILCINFALVLKKIVLFSVLTN